MIDARSSHRRWDIAFGIALMSDCLAFCATFLALLWASVDLATMLIYFWIVPSLAAMAVTALMRRRAHQRMWQMGRV